MGKSLKNALADLLGSLKASQKKSAKQQKKELKKKLYGGKSVEKRERQADLKEKKLDSRASELSFAEMMARDGVEPAAFDQNKLSRRSSTMHSEPEAKSWERAFFDYRGYTGGGKHRKRTSTKAS